MTFKSCTMNAFDTGLLCIACHAIPFPIASQSPNDGPIQRFFFPILRISASTKSFMLSYWRGSASSSPN